MRNDNDEDVAEGRVTTAVAVGLVEAESACAVVETSPDAHIPLGGDVVKGGKIKSWAKVAFKAWVLFGIAQRNDAMEEEIK